MIYSPSKIAKLIVDAYNSGAGIFKNKVNAEDLVPKTSKVNQIQFLFWVIQMDYATKSSALYKNANALWKRNPDWIKSEYIVSLDDVDLRELIKTQLRPRYTNEISIRFKKNAVLLQIKYNGLAINIIKASTSAEDLLSRIMEFRGLGPKTGNFLFRTFVDLLNLQYPDLDKIFQPVDVHDVRLTYEWGLISSKEMTRTNINNVKEIWNKACKDAKVSWINFDKALWLIGSEGERTDNAVEDFHNNIGYND